MLFIKKGKEMTITDVKKCLLKNLSITEAKNVLVNKLIVF